MLVSNIVSNYYGKLLKKTTPEFVELLFANKDLVKELMTNDVSLLRLREIYNQSIVPLKTTLILNFADDDIINKILNCSNFSMSRNIDLPEEFYENNLQYNIIINFDEFRLRFYQYYSEEEGYIYSQVEFGNDNESVESYVNDEFLTYLFKIRDTLGLNKLTTSFRIYQSIWKIATFGTEIEPNENGLSSNKFEYIERQRKFLI
jgi:hypothetical protein